jgi:hypothetical protein
MSATESEAQRLDAERSDPAGAEPSQASDGEQALRRQRIAEAAYYNAERRGFREGGELEDWLEAERRIHGEEGTGDRRAEATAASDDARAAALDPATAESAAMPDDGVVQPDAATQIEPDAVRTWAKRLNVSPARLRQAIKRVGPLVSEVKRFVESARR